MHKKCQNFYLILLNYLILSDVTVNLNYAKKDNDGNDDNKIMTFNDHYCYYTHIITPTLPVVISRIPKDTQDAVSESV
jgi:hypothetical protein